MFAGLAAGAKHGRYGSSVWEVGLLTSFKREVDQRDGVLRLYNLDPTLKGYFQNDRFLHQFGIFANLEDAIAEKGS